MTEPGSKDLTLMEAATVEFSTVFVKSFVLTIMAAVVVLRLFIGVRQRLARDRNVIDADSGPSSR
jgi:hypothetical protein